MKVIQSVPADNRYFQETAIPDGNAPADTEIGIINIFDDVTYQEVLGFGGAFTESAAYLYSLLSDEQKAEFMQRYFDRDKGIGYNFGRTHINSCDFSLDIYAYVQDGDVTLETFDISRDKQYIIPFIKDAMAYATEPLTLFASPWSPPAYMKDSNNAVGGKVKEEFKALWAKYYTEYIKAFRAEGIAIEAISVQNEPFARPTWEHCTYSAQEEREFIEQYLAPALDAAGMSDIKIIVWDHNKERVYDRAKQIFQSEPVKERVWGVGHHWYSGDHFDGLRLVHEQFGKVIISTENCGTVKENVNVLAERYGKEICEDFNHFTAGYCDWNLLLSDQGGPFHNRSAKTTACAGVVYEDKSCGCYAPVIYDYEQKQLVYTPIYYYIGHFSKFVHKGAVRIAITKYHEHIHACAFRNPDGSLVAVIVNAADREMPAVIRHNNECTEFAMPAHSIATVLL